MTTAESLVLILALVLMCAVVIGPALPTRIGALLTTLALVAIALAVLVATVLVVLHQWRR